jgi:hypothetical protein
MEIYSKNLIIDKIFWPNLTINENGKTKKIWLNPRNVSNICIDYTENTISIQMPENVYKIFCERIDFSKKVDLIERYFIFKI